MSAVAPICVCIISLFTSGSAPQQSQARAAAEWPLKPVQQILNETSPEFRQFDKNGDGTIDKSELPPVLGPVRIILESRDANKDGRITRKEYQSQDERTTAGPRLPAIGVAAQIKQSLFDRLDGNKDGKLTRDEVPEPMKALTKKYFDIAGKDELTAADWMAAYEKLAAEKGKPTAKPAGPDFFETLDKDGNGRLTLDEIEKAEANPAELKLSGVQTRPLFEAIRRSNLESLSRQQFNDILIPIVRQADIRRALTNSFRKVDTNNDGKISVAEAPREDRADLEKFLSSNNLPLSAELTLPEFIRLVEERQQKAPQRLPQKPAAFQIMDSNRDGFIVPEELRDATDLISRLGRLDGNGDERISLEEFIGTPGSAAPFKPEPPPEEPVDNKSDKEKQIAEFVTNFFNQFDKDKNGKLTTDEIDAARIKKADYDSDGAMSSAELTEFMYSR